MEQLLRRDVGGRVAVAMVTERDDGDVHPQRVDAALLRRRQIASTGSPWVMLDEVHGTSMVTVDARAVPTFPLAGIGDILLTERPDAMLAVWVADCAPVALFGANGETHVVAHAGWRGLADGVLDAGVDAIESTGTTVAAAVLGPCIHACCYEFGTADLERVALGVGASVTDVSGVTDWGTGALDMPRAVAASLQRRGVSLDVVGPCTGCDQRFHSHRRRQELARHALVAWFEEVS